MATRRQLQELALLRLQEAETLYTSGLYDGCAYLCGYVVELALKARICATLGVVEYPEKGSRLRDAMKSHALDDLGLLAGMGEVGQFEFLNIEVTLVYGKDSTSGPFLA